MRNSLFEFPGNSSTIPDRIPIPNQIKTRGGHLNKTQTNRPKIGQVKGIVKARRLRKPISINPYPIIPPTPNLTPRRLGCTHKCPGEETHSPTCRSDFRIRTFYRRRPRVNQTSRNRIPDKRVEHSDRDILEISTQNSENFRLQLHSDFETNKKMWMKLLTI